MHGEWTGAIDVAADGVMDAGVDVAVDVDVGVNADVVADAAVDVDVGVNAPYAVGRFDHNIVDATYANVELHVYVHASMGARRLVMLTPVYSTWVSLNMDVRVNAVTHKALMFE